MKQHPPETTLEVELRELRRLARQRKLLELPATIFTERAPDHCIGECEHPVVLSNVGMTCCHFYLGYVRYNEIVKLEQLQRQAVEYGRRSLGRSFSRAEIEGSGLQETYPRDFTGTYVGKKPKGLTSSSEDPKSPQANLKQSKGKP